MNFKRDLFWKLEKYLSEPEILVVTGMRRVGKSTLLRQLFESIKSQNKVFIDIENTINQKLFEELDFDNVRLNLINKFNLDSNKQIYIFLDEIQAFPEIVKIIKYLFDHHQFKFVVTGSSSYYFKNLFPESLSGRKFVFEMYPLSFKEFLRFKGFNQDINKDLDKLNQAKSEILFESLKIFYSEYLEFGGFPRVVTTEDKTIKFMVLEDIYKSYFELDVRQMADFTSLRNFRDTILLLANRVGSKLDISRIATEIGTSRENIYKYIYFLEQTFFIDLLAPFSRSSDKEVSGSKKIYFCDTGILNYLNTTSTGSLLENAVYNNLKLRGKLNFYERRSGGEIDFILDQKYALEVKQTGTDQDLKKLQSLATDLGLTNPLVLTQNFNPKTDFIPSAMI
jgi:predicted AAA+ superfamily ATPase